MRDLIDTSAAIGAIERKSPALIELIGQAGGPGLRSITVLGELHAGSQLAATRDHPERHTTLGRYELLTEWPDAEVELREFAAAFGVISEVGVKERSKANQNDRWIIAEAVVNQVDRFITSDVAQGSLARLAFDATDCDIEVVVTG